MYKRRKEIREAAKRKAYVLKDGQLLHGRSNTEERDISAKGRRGGGRKQREIKGKKQEEREKGKRENRFPRGDF